MVDFQASLQLLRATLARDLPYMLSIIFVAATLLVFVIADSIIIQHRQKIDELELDLSTALTRCAENEAKLLHARSTLFSYRITEGKTGTLKRELEATRAELASATETHQQEQANTANLEAKLKESEKTVRLLGQSNRKARELAQDLLTQTMALHNQIAGSSAQLRSARTDIDSHKEMVRRLQVHVVKAEQKISNLGLERSHLAAQLASERGEKMELTKQLEQEQQKVTELGKSTDKAWTEVKEWRENPIWMVRKAEEWKRHLAGEPLLGEERDQGLTWDSWMRMEEVKQVVVDARDELEVQVDEEEEEMPELLEMEHEEWEEDTYRGEEESGENEEWTEVEDEEWSEVEDEDSEVSSHF